MWYADKRDIVKLGGIVNLCSTKKIKHVLQIAYYRDYTWPQLEFDNKPIDVPKKVIKHFRDIEDIKRLGESAGLSIEVIKDTFGNRKNYHSTICEKIKSQKAEKIVFLNPDTGLAPTKSKATHVKPEEIEMIWATLKPKDILVLYQHGSRTNTWAQDDKEQFAKACGVRPEQVGVWQAKQIASDVIFLFVEKSV